uniref:PNPLA domain-containing protein n=1 Tax=Corethron hystrix TaxID=216773 RepID=A0A7S1FYE6_9STRA|eukprot:CAMPEP_0113308980 /NCGR_PEP_ID=MMETSP0010_2-20120614/7214_1 /TAXON_ID=216773 ORGANISM="Corethron hystrix, Strain 308" /NCGR_SAMPLE_ID=MMETSP0010_2 /ASSEMBLY_ACC=CAM_ASM_000155 /LENGTH=632 /DNA_ID=CAMNT_0000164155 /DNA_START=28 /DNA_END=1926 /DNA_ORIENTATION=+ /assembly_acc=CAM_ASM_000155
MKISVPPLALIGILLRGTEARLAGRSERQEPTDEQEIIGLALPGGSFTAATIGAGIMRGFQQQYVAIDGETHPQPALNKFKYVSGLSGGNLPSIMNAYAQDATTDEMFDVNGLRDPSEITARELDTLAEKSIFKTLATSVVPFMPASLKDALVGGEDFFTEVVYGCCLEPHGIKHDAPLSSMRDEVKYTPIVETAMVGPAELFPNFMFFAMNVAFGNANVANVAELMDVAEEGMRFTLNDNAIMWQNAEAAGHQIPIPAFITPEKFSIPHLSSRWEYDSVGNKQAEPIDFTPVYSNPNELQPGSEGEYTVKKMLAMSTNLMSLMTYDVYDENTDPGYILNTVNAPMLQDIPMANGRKRSMAFTDGGFVDFSGIPALVKMGANKIVVPIFTTMKPEDIAKMGGPEIVLFYSVARFFGILQSPIANLEYDYFDFSYAGGYTSMLFNPNSNDEDQMAKLERKIRALYAAGGPVVVTLDDLEVVDNPFWGIEGGGKVDLTIMAVMDVPPKFSEQIDPAAVPPPPGKAMTENRYFTNPEYADVPILASYGNYFQIDFPNLNITHTTPLPLELAVSKKGCKMTEILVSWMVREAWDGLVGSDGEELFSGFSYIFGEEVDTTQSQSEVMASDSHATAVF